MKRVFLCAALVAGTAAAPLVAAADPGGVKVGTLTCNESGGWGYVIGGSHAVNCVFRGEGRNEHYTGKISKLGVDIGYQSAGTLVWSVFAATSDMRPGSLGGHYGGVTAGAAVGVGVAANALVGGFNRSFTLQPVSVEGTSGINIAAGVGELTLHPGR
ncbi:MAG TPA: DUF992 domain-containing protein [Caulobacteraceae bacterium]|jgi:hypothetical protein|nr:DUF992 domain-containing protein [Caulobacteraceae bacterium]